MSGHRGVHNESPIYQNSRQMCRDQSRYAPSPWKTSLQCNDVSHWLCAYLDWSLYMNATSADDSFEIHEVEVPWNIIPRMDRRSHTGCSPSLFWVGIPTIGCCGMWLLIHAVTLTHLPLDKMAAISQTIFHMYFDEWKVLYSDYIFIEVCS